MCTNQYILGLLTMMSMSMKNYSKVSIITIYTLLCIISYADCHYLSICSMIHLSMIHKPWLISQYTDVDGLMRSMERPMLRGICRYLRPPTLSTQYIVYIVLTYSEVASQGMLKWRYTTSPPPPSSAHGHKC